MNLPLRAYWSLLAAHIRPQRGRFMLMSALLLGGIGLQIVNPQIIRAFIDAALGGAAASELILPALAFTSIALLQQVVSVAVIYLSENVAWTATNTLRAEIVWHCLNLDMDFHNNHTPGELIERIDGDVTELANFFSQFVVILAGNLLLLAGVLTAMYLVDWRAGLVFSLYALAALYTLNRVRDIAVPFQKGVRQAEADLFGFIEEQLGSTEDVRSSGAIGFSLRELFRFQSVVLRHERKAEFRRWIVNVVMGGLMISGTLLAVLTGYFLFSAGAITIGAVYLFVHYANLLETPLWTLTHEVQSFQTVGACVERLVALKAIQPRIQDAPPGDISSSPNTGLQSDLNTATALTGCTSPYPVRAAGLAFDGVTFAYHPGDPVLRDLSFELQPGKILGLLGRTGSGKSTLARLVFRLYDPTQGQIRLDDQDIRALRLGEVRSRVAMVTQEVQIFQASVRDNLTFFDKRISDDQILAAIHELELGDWYRSLPTGLDTKLESGSRSLSAGEAQLLAFTRVLLRNPGLVILDEASSRLDPQTEQRIERAIDRLLQDRSAIIIAHRLGTVHRAEHVLIIDQGRVSEYGERRLLAHDPGSQFYHLLQTGLEEVLA